MSDFDFLLMIVPRMPIAKIATVKRMRVSTQPGIDSFFFMIFIDLSSLPIFMNLANLRSFRKRGMINKGVIPKTISFSPISVRNGEAPTMMKTSSLWDRTHSKLLGAIRNRIVASRTKNSQMATLSGVLRQFFERGASCRNSQFLLLGFFTLYKSCCFGKTVGG